MLSLDSILSSKIWTVGCVKSREFTLALIMSEANVVSKCGLELSDFASHQFLLRERGRELAAHT